MSTSRSGGIKQPRTDERPLWDVLLGIWGYPAVLVAQELGLFDLLGEAPRTVEEVCADKGIRPRPAGALLSICTSLGFVQLAEGKYSLTTVAEDYLMRSSPTYFGWLFESLGPIYSLFSPDSIRRAVLTDAPQGVFADPAGPFAAWHAKQAAFATRVMHSMSFAAGLAWPDRLDLSRHRAMLDLGGGSGAHSIGALNRWPDLRSVVLDQPAICALAQQYAMRYGVADRLSTHTADFFRDPLPDADLHFYGMIFHDWPPAQCRELAARSFQSLPPGGRIVVHEMLFNDDRTGPFPVAAFNIDMLVAMPGQQYSGKEVSEMLASAGFTDIAVVPTFGYWSVVTGQKR